MLGLPRGGGGGLKRCWRFPAHGNSANKRYGRAAKRLVGPIGRAPGPFPPLCPRGSDRGLSGAAINPSRGPGTVTEGCARRVPPGWDTGRGGGGLDAWGKVGTRGGAGTVLVLCWDSLRLCWERLGQRWDNLGLCSGSAGTVWDCPGTIRIVLGQCWDS